jgi:hypothetical protein
MELDADLALELWDIFAASIQPKEKSIVAESYINWLMENNISDDELADLARQDQYLGSTISEMVAENDIEDDNEDE